jgi:hypothetical protein
MDRFLPADTYDKPSLFDGLEEENDSNPSVAQMSYTSKPETKGGPAACSEKASLYAMSPMSSNWDHPLVLVIAPHESDPGLAELLDRLVREYSQHNRGSTDPLDILTQLRIRGLHSEDIIRLCDTLEANQQASSRGDTHRQSDIDEPPHIHSLPNLKMSTPATQFSHLEHQHSASSLTAKLGSKGLDNYHGRLAGLNRKETGYQPFAGKDLEGPQSRKGRGQAFSGSGPIRVNGTSISLAKQSRRSAKRGKHRPVRIGDHGGSTSGSAEGYGYERPELDALLEGEVGSFSPSISGESSAAFDSIDLADGDLANVDLADSDLADDDLADGDLTNGSVDHSGFVVTVSGTAGLEGIDIQQRMIIQESRQSQSLDLEGQRARERSKVLLIRLQKYGPKSTYYAAAVVYIFSGLIPITGSEEMLIKVCMIVNALLLVFGTCIRTRMDPELRKKL